MLSSPRRAFWSIVTTAFVLPLAFAWITGHVWEDYYITLRSSRNLVEGHGLVFQPGERLHTFTSPLGVLLPAACLWLAGGDDKTALWMFRLGSALALAVAAALLWRSTRRLGVGATGTFTLFGLWLLDPKLLDFSSNGMETAFLVAAVLGLWCELDRAPAPRAQNLGGWYALLMWTRPDSFIIAGALTVTRLFFRSTSEPPVIRTLVLGAVIGILLYLPWLLAAWRYYGTPVPHTIVAKGGITAPVTLSNLLLIPFRTVLGHSMTEYLFLPANYTFGDWPYVCRLISRSLVMLAAFTWILPGWPASGRRTSLALFCGLFYIGTILLFGWYVPPWTALAALALGVGADSLARRPALARWVKAGAIAAVLFQFLQLAAVTWQMRTQQRVIEDGGRRQIGLWLREQARPGETVFLEPLGYIGYYSGLKTYDFPGLSSKEVTAAIQGGARRYGDVILQLQPDWVVLRPFEIEREQMRSSEVLKHYDLVRTWDARPSLEKIEFLPGRAWLEFDAQFEIYRLRTPSRAP